MQMQLGEEEEFNLNIPLSAALVRLLCCEILENPGVMTFLSHLKYYVGMLVQSCRYIHQVGPGTTMSQSFSFSNITSAYAQIGPAMKNTERPRSSQYKETIANSVQRTSQTYFGSSVWYSNVWLLIWFADIYHCHCTTENGSVTTTTALECTNSYHLH